MTTNDDNVFALDATTGEGQVALARRTTSRSSSNFGIVANRGVALCDGHVFLLTLDMTIVVARRGDRRQLERRVPIARGGPGRVVELRLLRDERADLRATTV